MVAGTVGGGRGRGERRTEASRVQVISRVTTAPGAEKGKGEEEAVAVWPQLCAEGALVETAQQQAALNLVHNVRVTAPGVQTAGEQEKRAVVV